MMIHNVSCFTFKIHKEILSKQVNWIFESVIVDEKKEHEMVIVNLWWDKILFTLREL
jgi:hypothetical protein